MAAIVKNGNVVGGGGSESASFEELSYADYQAGNYDKTKSYAIPDYPYSGGNAGNISFNDSTAKLGADDVQGVIDVLASKVKTIRISNVTLTTSAIGTVTASLLLSSNKFIVAAYATGYDVRVYTNSSGVQGFRVNTINDDGSLTPAANKSVDITAVIVEF